MKHLMIFILIFSLLQAIWIYGIESCFEKAKDLLRNHFEKLEPTESFAKFNFRKKTEVFLGITVLSASFLVKLSPAVAAAFYCARVLNMNGISFADRIAYLPLLVSILITASIYLVIGSIHTGFRRYKARKIYFESALKRAREIYPNFDEDKEVKKKVLSKIERADFHMLGIDWYTENPEKQYTNLDSEIKYFLEGKQTEQDAATAAENPS